MSGRAMTVAATPIATTATAIALAAARRFRAKWPIARISGESSLRVLAFQTLRRPGKLLRSAAAHAIEPLDDSLRVGVAVLLERGLPGPSYRLPLATLRDWLPLRERSLPRDQLLDQGPGPVHRVLDLDLAVYSPNGEIADVLLSRILRPAQAKDEPGMRVSPELA